VIVDCGSLAASLIEAAFFGHEQRAPSPAPSARAPAPSSSRVAFRMLGPAPATRWSGRQRPACRGPRCAVRELVLERFTALYVKDMLRRHDGNVTAAAASAGMARRHFHRLKRASD
jgi:DNA-binding NtrC family response regulator